MQDFIIGPEWDKRVLSLNPGKRVGVLMSSGMDSTTLFCMLTKYFDVDIEVFNIQTSENPDKPIVQDILDAMSFTKELHIVGSTRWQWPMQSHYPRLARGMQEIRDHFAIDNLYCGNILTPHPQFFPRWDVNQTGISKRPWLTNDSFLKNPLEHMEKYHVLDCARKHGFEDVIDMTISCNVYAEKECGDCMGCLERKWAYDQLDKENGTSLDEMANEAVMKYGAIGW